MKKKSLYLILVAVLIVLMVGAVLLYKNFSGKINPDGGSNSEEELDLAPDFEVQNDDGDMVLLSDNYGKKPIVVNFWATWCPPCISELPAFNNLADEYGDDVIFMMVNMTDGYQEKLDDVKSFISDNGYSFPVYYDTEYSAANAYFVSSIPKTIFINKNGELTDTHLGAMSEETLENYIKGLIE